MDSQGKDRRNQCRPQRFDRVVSCLAVDMPLCKESQEELRPTPMVSLLPVSILIATSGSLNEPDGEDAVCLTEVGAALRSTTTHGEPRTTLVLDPVAADLPAAELLSQAAAKLLSPRPTTTYPSVVVFVGLETEVRPGLALRLLLDSGEVRAGSSLEPELPWSLTTDGLPLDEGMLSLARIRELAVELVRPHWRVDVGRHHTRVGQSLIFDDFGTGASASLDLDGFGVSSLRGEAAVFIVGHSLDELSRPSPLSSVRLSFEPSLFESVGLFGALFIDKNGMLQDVLAATVSEAIIDSPRDIALLANIVLAERTGRGHLAYVGADAQLLPADRLSVRGIGTVALGEMTFTAGSSAHNFALSSWAASAEVSYGLTSRAGIGAFAFALSGDLPAVPDGNTTDYHGFIGIAPYWTWTGLFFSGGVSQGLYPGRATAAGVNGHGVAGGGARVDWSTESLYGEVRAASMWALADPPLFGGSRRWYGIEVDGVLEWDVWAWATLAIEADVLWPGGFFPQRDVAFRLIGQLHVHASNHYP